MQHGSINASLKSDSKHTCNSIAFAHETVLQTQTKNHTNTTHHI